MFVDPCPTAILFSEALSSIGSGSAFINVIDGLDKFNSTEDCSPITDIVLAVTAKNRLAAL